MASIKKRELKEAKDKSNLLEQEKNKLKAMEYDQIKAKQQEFVPAAPELKPIPAKKKVKKIIEVEETESEEEYEEVIVKKRVGRPRVQQQQQPEQYTELLYQSAQESIKNKVMEERAKNLMQHLMPRC